MYKPYYMKRAKLAIHSETLRDEDQRIDRIALVKSTKIIPGYGFFEIDQELPSSRIGSRSASHC